MNTPTPQSPSASGPPPWFHRKAADLELDQIAPQLIKDSTCRVSPFSVTIRISSQDANPPELKISRVSDVVMRLLLWLLPFSMFFIMKFVESMRILPAWGGFWYTGCLLAFIAAVLVANVNSNFESLVKVAVARATDVKTKGDMVRETLGLFAILRHLRPWLSKYERLLVNWGNRGNNMNLYALEPLKLALDLLWELDGDAKGWEKRTYFDQHIKTVAGQVEKLEKVWFKDLKIPLYLIELEGAIAIAGAIIWTAYQLFHLL